jgi:signal transduction histidine kinase
MGTLLPVRDCDGNADGSSVTMNQPDATDKLTPDRLLESVTRTLRHEVGDLLQTVYSTVAILQERFPADAQMERRFLADLRGRAETCRDELDAVHDLILPLTLKLGSVDLTELAEGMVASFSSRQRSIKIRAEQAGSLPVTADAHRLTQVGRLLMAGACQSARQEVVVRTRPAARGEAEWAFADDGYGATPEQLRWLATPFATTQQALCGLGLALARKVVELHGGRVSAENQPQGGFMVTLTLPARPRA